MAPQNNGITRGTNISSIFLPAGEQAGISVIDAAGNVSFG